MHGLECTKFMQPVSVISLSAGQRQRKGVFVFNWKNDSQDM